MGLGIKISLIVWECDIINSVMGILYRGSIVNVESAGLYPVEGFSIFAEMTNVLDS